MKRRQIRHPITGMVFKASRDNSEGENALQSVISSGRAQHICTLPVETDAGGGDLHLFYYGPDNICAIATGNKGMWVAPHQSLLDIVRLCVVHNVRHSFEKAYYRLLERIDRKETIPKVSLENLFK